MRRALCVLGAACTVACARATPVPEPAFSHAVAVATFDSAWSVVYHTHFDTTFHGVNWLAARDELRPRAERARSTDALRGVIQDMIARLGESHFALFPREITSGAADSMVTGIGTPGLTLRMIGRDVVVERADSGGGAARAGVKAGWTVRRAGGYSVDDFAASPFAKMPNMTPDILALAMFYGPAGDTIRGEFLDDRGRAVTRSIVRQKQEGVPVKFGNMPAMVARLEQRSAGGATSRGGAARAGVIWFNVWMPPTVPAFDRAIDELRDASGIVIDLRDNPGGYAPTISGIAGHFFGERTTLGTFRYRASESKTTANPRLVTADGRRVGPYAGPVAILIGPRTGSASEVFAGGMQATGRARVFGERSAGQVLPATMTALPNGDVLYHALADFTTASGVRLEGRGVIPDVVAPPTRATLLAGNDSALDSALAWIAVSGHPGPAALFAPARAQTPSAADIFARAAKAVDPQGLLAARKSSHSRSTIELVGTGISGTMEGFAATPARVYTRMEIGPLGTIESGHDGTTGWIINPSTGPSLMDASQVARIRHLNAFDYWLHKPETFRAVATPVAVTFEGRPSYEVHLTARDGWEYDEYFDVETGFRRGLEYVDTANGGHSAMTMVFDDYKLLAGVMIPGTITQRTPSATIVQRAMLVEFDAAPDSVFALPAAIKALVTR